MNGSIEKRKRQKGTALVESAITLPLMLLLMLVGGEMTNAFMAHNTLTKAVRDGSRYVSGKAINGARVLDLNAQLVNEARNLVVYGNIAGNGNPVLPGFNVGNVFVSDIGNNRIEVRAQYAYSGITGSVIPGFGYGPDSALGMTLEASVRMRAL